jgi:hypothetical protein
MFGPTGYGKLVTTEQFVKERKQTNKPFENGNDIRE